MNIGFIGAGNMGGALAKAISKNLETNIYVYDKSCEKADELARSINACATDFNEVVKNSDFIFLGVKPNVLAEVAREVGTLVRTDTVIVSMAAGVEIQAIEEALAKKLPIVRIMPNTPVAVGEGLTAYATNSLVSEQNIRSFEKFMSFTGSLEYMQEDEIDTFCAIAGCGPAYAYMFIEALAKGAQKCGANSAAAIKYASKMVRGSALMALESGIDPKTLCRNVCSPGGATIEGVKVLEAHGFEDVVSSAIEAAFKRTKELGK